MREEIEQYRSEIDLLDQQLHALYKERLNVSRKVGAYKKKHQIAILDAEREKVIKNHVKNRYEADEDLLAYMYLHDAMMLVSRNAQYVYPEEVASVQENESGPKQVGYQGVAGSFSSIAASHLFPNAQVQTYETFDAVFTAVETGEITFGILPLENSIHGEVIQVIDLLRERNVFIVEEITESIEHCLLSVAGASIDTIKEVHSHPQALAQTDRYLKSHPTMTPVASLNTAMSAKFVSEQNDVHIAAIASKEAAQEYGLTILDTQIENFSSNQTRFVVIANALRVRADADKTSIVLTVDHKSGSLAQVVAQFQYEHINMLKITSRPIQNQPWQYQFFIDFEGSVRDERVQKLIYRLQTETLKLEVLGSYPSIQIKSE